MSTVFLSDGTSYDGVIQIWNDGQNAARYRAFWTNGPEATSGCPVVGYAATVEGSHKTIRAAVAQVRRLGYTDPIYRNGEQIA